MPLLLQSLAALIGVICIKFVERELKLKIERVLNWIGSKRTLTKFVENRLKGIRSDREINSHYIASLENPADFASHDISLDKSMIIKLLTEHHLEFLSLKGGYTGSSESTHVKMPHCWKSHSTAHLICFISFYLCSDVKFWLKKQNRLCCCEI